jgi:hypothetical protein
MSIIDVGSNHPQTGDRMNATEFRKKTCDLPEGTKVELIEGIVYMAAAVKLAHGQPHVFLSAWMAQYSFATPGIEYSDNVTHQLDDQNEPQPDLSLFIHPDCGGQVRISDDGYVIGGPELVAEIAVSSLPIDRGPKRRVYEDHGVREYLLWRVEDRLIEWYVLRDGVYKLLPIDPDGVIRSAAFPGLWMDVEATLRRDGPAAMTVLQHGLASDDHEACCRRLRSNG